MGKMHQLPEEVHERSAEDEALAFILNNREMLLRRIKGKLGADRWRRIDPDDVFSSGLRRLHVMWLEGAFAGSCRGDLLAVAYSIVLNVAKDQSELYSWMKRAPKEVLDVLEARVESADCGREAAQKVHRVFLSLRKDDERELFLLRLQQRSFRQIASQLGCSEVAARQRWTTLCRYLRTTFAPPPSKTHTLPPQPSATATARRCARADKGNAAVR